MLLLLLFFFFFFNDTATTEIYTLSLHDALPIFAWLLGGLAFWWPVVRRWPNPGLGPAARLLYVLDRKSTRLNSSHLGISYAVFCLKKKKKEKGAPPSAQRCKDDSRCDCAPRTTR